MNFYGIIMGITVFLLIGAGHVMVIKGEYYFGYKLWVLFFCIALISTTSSLFVNNALVSGILGITGFTFFWSIHEIIEQRQRVKAGKFPKNPKRTP